MQPNEYQAAALVTRNTELDHYQALANWALGLSGETGELADLIKKHIFHGHEIDREKVVKELGDVAWYLAVLASQFGISLNEVLEKNVAKLRARYGEKFSQQRSKERDTQAEDRAVESVADRVLSSALQARFPFPGNSPKSAESTELERKQIASSSRVVSDSSDKAKRDSELKAVSVPLDPACDSDAPKREDDLWQRQWENTKSD